MILSVLAALCKLGWMSQKCVDSFIYLLKHISDHALYCLREKLMFAFEFDPNIRFYVTIISLYLLFLPFIGSELCLQMEEVRWQQTTC